MMNTDLTEAEMRMALFGSNPSTATTPPEPESPPEMIFTPPAKSLKSKGPKKPQKTFTPRLQVVLQVGNEFEGATQEYVHQADTLSTLLASQEAVRAARKKFKYVEVLSVKPM